MAEHPEACAAWQQPIAGWLVAQLAPDEERALLAHLAGCDTCRTEAEQLLAVAATSLGASLPSPPEPLLDLGPPPSDLGPRIVRQVRRERRSRPALLVAAVGALAVVIAAVAVRAGDDPASLRGEPVTFASLPAGAQASAVLAPSGDGSLIEVRASGLEPGRTYELWLTPPGGGYRARVPAGTFRPDGEGAVDVRLDSALPPDRTGRVWATSGGAVVLDTEPAS